MKKIKLEYNSPVVLTFTIISIAVFFMDKLIPIGLMDNFFVYYGGYSALDIVRMFLYPLGHGSMDHLLGNMTFILLIGPMLEEKYSSKTIALLMLVTTLTIGISHLLFINSGILGASGIVFMMIILSSFTNMKKDSIPVTFILVAILFLGKEIYNGMFVNNNVSEIAHILGAVIGMIHIMIRNLKKN